MNKKSNNNILGLIKRNHLLKTVEENIYKSINRFQTDYIKKCIMYEVCGSNNEQMEYLS